MARNLIASDQTIKAVKPGDPRKRLNDGDGLFLLLFVKGGAHGWRFAYSLHGKRNNLSLGVYPDVGLAQARKGADAARALVAAGVDPSETRKSSKVDIERRREADRRADAGLPSADSFEGVAREWYETRKGEWSTSYGEKILARLVADVFPYIGRRPIGEITPPQLLEVLRRVESRGVIETAHRARENCSQVFRFAIATGRAERDAAQDLSDALKKPQVKHFAAITDPKRLGELLRACHGYAGTPVVRTALRLAPMLMLRPGELLHAEWSEIDLDTATWTVPAQRMKREKAGKMNGVPHIVPLPTQAVEAFRDLEPITGGGQWVFRGERHHDRPMSENTVNAALRAMGFPADEATGHGFRATARTMLAERLDVDASIVEAQLAHSVRDSLGRAYTLPSRPRCCASQFVLVEP
jgi:integrase